MKRNPPRKPKTHYIMYTRESPLQKASQRTIKKRKILHFLRLTWIMEETPQIWVYTQTYIESGVVCWRRKDAKARVKELATWPYNIDGSFLCLHCMSCLLSDIPTMRIMPREFSSILCHMQNYLLAKKCAFQSYISTFIPIILRIL